VQPLLDLYGGYITEMVLSRRGCIVAGHDEMRCGTRKPLRAGSWAGAAVGLGSRGGAPQAADPLAGLPDASEPHSLLLLSSVSCVF
jgi:hypothetical protein